MGDKKGKALALELMDDLLNEDAEDIELAEEQPAKKSAAKVKAEEKSAEDAYEHSMANLELDAGGTEILGGTEVSDAQHEAPQGGDEDRTVRITPSQMPQPSAHPQAQSGGGKVRASVGRFAGVRTGGPSNSTEAALAQSESLRIAQGRLLEFEQEIERLRLQNEELAAAGETLRRRTDELLATNQKREQDYRNAVSTFQQEKEILNGSKEALQRELELLRQKSEELELRISTNIQKIRVRERELENRLELVKMESAAVIRNKDEMVLELKRNIDQLNLELNNYRAKNQELNRQTNDKQEQLRRTVKALRLALSMLEGEEEMPKAAPASQVRKVK